MPLRCALPLLTLVLVGVAPGFALSAEDDPFAVSVIPTRARTVAAEILDVDGDGRADLVVAIFDGVPPEDRRTLEIHFQSEAGFQASPDLTMPLPPGAAAFDAADVLPDPGVELLILWREGVRIISFAGREPRVTELRIPSGVTAGPAADERGLSRLPIASFAFGAEPVLVVPGLGDAFLLSPSGALRARLDVGGRANYFVQARGLLYAESDIQIFFDAPRLSAGDIDGDGRADVLSASRHELRVFLQRPGGDFARDPDRRIPLRRVSLQDHMRGSGTVRATAGDIDGDGRIDLMISEMSGGLTDSKSLTSIHFNRRGEWDLEHPDLVLRREKSVGVDQLLDVDGDGRLELLQGHIPLTVLELVEVFLTRSFDARMALYRLSPDGSRGRQPKPWIERKLGIPISFDTGRLRGFIPSFDHDLNGDGYLDFLHSADGKALEIYLGGPESRYRKRVARQKLDVEGVLRTGDLDGDGLVDFVLSNPRRAEAPIRLLRNRGVLPGTPPSSRSSDAADLSSRSSGAGGL